MDTLVIAGAAVAVAAAVVALARRLRSGPKDDDSRFVLRVTVVSPDRRPVRLGTSVDPGEVPSHEPSLTSTEATLLDDADNLVVLPAGLNLDVRSFDGAERAPLDMVTTSSGIARRWSFDVPPGVRFWILDAPAWQGCMGTADPRRRSLPPRSGGYEITTRLPPEPEADADGHIGVTLASITIPLWMHGLEQPDGWLAGARSTDEEPRLAIPSFEDPLLDTVRDDRVGSVAFQIADAVWLETSARATVGVPIVIGRARISTREGLKSGDDFEVWRSRLGASTILCWGAAKASLDREGFEVRLRVPGDADKTLDGTLPAVKAAVVAELLARGEGRPAATLTRPIGPVPEALEGAYATVCDLLVLLVLAHPNNQALPVQTPETQRKIVALAKDLFDAASASDVACLTWLAATIYALDCGGLGADQRAEALAFVRARTDEDDPVRRLAPALFHRLGESGEAFAACERALAEATTDGYREATGVRAAYRAWLDKVRAKVSGS